MLTRCLEGSALVGFQRQEIAGPTGQDSRSDLLSKASGSISMNTRRKVS
jgi:hypothetical protein